MMPKGNWVVEQIERAQKSLDELPLWVRKTTRLSGGELPQDASEGGKHVDEAKKEPGIRKGKKTNAA